MNIFGILKRKLLIACLASAIPAAVAVLPAQAQYYIKKDKEAPAGEQMSPPAATSSAIPVTSSVSSPRVSKKSLPISSPGKDTVDDIPLTSAAAAARIRSVVPPAYVPHPEYDEALKPCTERDRQDLAAHQKKLEDLSEKVKKGDKDAARQYGADFDEKIIGLYARCSSVLAAQTKKSR